MSELHFRAGKIRLACFDVDGVLTDGRLYYTDDGHEIKAFDVKDGHGLKMLQESGVETAIITSRSSRAVELRARNLAIKHLYQAVSDKRKTWEALLAQLGLTPEQSSYMGDDLVDLPVMRRCGLAITVPDAPALVTESAHYITRAPGGRGAAREACELILMAQGNFQAAVAPFLA